MDCAKGGVMSLSDLERAKRDMNAGDAYIAIFERHAGKKCSPRMRKWLHGAFMSGVKHGRQTAPKSSEQDMLSEILAGRGKGWLR
jgi:hypothetical protein